MKPIVGVLLRLTVFTAAMLVLLTVTVEAVRRPVTGDTSTFTAIFTDANGLKTNDDVRMFGVQVGKVEAVSLRDNQAQVRLTVQRAHPIYDATTFAIRFQTLAGQRYVDIRQPEKPAGELRSGDTIGTDRTIPSFDITTLFNGLEPVLAEFSPSALNRFTESMLAIIDGDSSGVGPALDEISKLSTYVTDRQAVISTLVHNLDEISQQLTGRSAQAITLLSGVTNVFSSLAQKVEGLIDFAVTAPPVFEPIDSIAATLGLTPGTNSDFDNAVRAAFPDPDTAIDVLGRLPGLLQSLNALLPSATSGVDLTCSNGAAEVPSSLQILLAGQRVAICNR